MTQRSQLQYYSTPLAERMLAHERHWLSHHIRTCVGSHAAMVTNDPYSRCIDVLEDFYLSVSVSSNAFDRNQICSNACQLPFPNESLDVLALQHVTDGSEQAVQILREAQRVLVLGGRLLFLATNPFSLFGMSAWLNAENNSQLCRKGLIKQCLSALDIQVLSAHSMFHEPPLNAEPSLRRSATPAKWAAHYNMPFGGVFGLVAIKSARPVNPIKWKKIHWNTAPARPAATQKTTQKTYEKR